MQKKRSRFSISTKWFINSFSVVLVLVVLADVLLFLALRWYYYGGVSQYLRAQANIIHGVMEYIGDYTPEIRRTVEDFAQKDRMELMAIDKDGVIDITSSGFSPGASTVMPDYSAAAANGKAGVGEYLGLLPDGERYMAVSVMLPDSAQYSALRVVTSLTNIDNQIYRTALIAGVLSMGVLLVVLFLGLYFVRSIVAPLRLIEQGARRLASGDFSKRIPSPRGNDEIAELCRIFNQMADELKHTEEVKNTFLSSVSHELRTPLTAIRGWGETMSGNDKLSANKEFSRGMRVILSETKRLSHMVEELLDFSHMQGGRFELNMEPIDALAELSDALLVYTETARSAGVALTLREPDTPAVMNGDPGRLRQVFINIIDNAIKYCNHIVSVEAYMRGGQLTITVNDDGRGISKQDLPKVTNRFFKGSNAVRGSGIGLSVAGEIIEKHGGTLEITSELGEGTTVEVTLPLTKRN